MRRNANINIGAVGEGMRAESKIFKVLGDPIRLRLAALLAIRGETCVCALARALNEPDFKISRHIGIMRSAGMVETRREGTWIFYRLAASVGDFENRVFKCLASALAGHPDGMKDIKRLDKAKCALLSRVG